MTTQHNGETRSPARARSDAGLDRLMLEARQLQQRPGDRVVLGIAGPPGAGKSTVTEHLERLFPGDMAVIGMDAYHRSDDDLRRLGRLQRKGAPDTFDVSGYVDMLRRVREQTDVVVRVPVFDRNLEASVADAVEVRPHHWLVVTEGNYLLLDQPSAWREVRRMLDAVWYLDLDAAVRRERLVQRRMGHGASVEEARAWVMTVDEPHARLVELTRSRADGLLAVDRGGVLRLHAPEGSPRG